MLQFLSEERTITGVDYDEEKIETAQHGYLKSDRLNFYCADVTEFPMQKYDVIIISDVLHYLEMDEQERLVNRCFEALNAGGKLIIRDGNRDLKERHKGTRVTEFFSVRLLKFNKSRNTLNFISGTDLTRKAKENGLTVEMRDNSHYTSNVIFVISKPEPAHAEI
jgi:2-polyprenyl-3-methyl-5-hydroxy-6-metoxy-1,4-benzoquinol methylase